MSLPKTTVVNEALKLRNKLSCFLNGIDEKSVDLMISAFTEFNPMMSTSKFFKWLEDMNRKILFKIKQVPLYKTKGWYFDDRKNFRHQSGKFFSIEGIKVKTNSGNVLEWSQPIIRQPEIGILGILCKKYNGILYFLMQAKVEPGNINKVQISPTVQATKSNFSQVHGGKVPPYLEYFLNMDNKISIIVDQLQSEQGARFFKKRNRNMIIEIQDEIKVLDNFCWLTLGQIKKLLLYPNIINMDTRTVLSCTQIKLT